jgi:hypothetical protein
VRCLQGSARICRFLRCLTLRQGIHGFLGGPCETLRQGPRSKGSPGICIYNTNMHSSGGPANPTARAAFQRLPGYLRTLPPSLSPLSLSPSVLLYLSSYGKGRVPKAPQVYTYIILLYICIISSVRMPRTSIYVWSYQAELQGADGYLIPLYMCAHVVRIPDTSISICSYCLHT